MTIYFNEKDLVSFGTYLLSEKRKARFEESYKEVIRNGVKNPVPTEERLKQVHDADIQNWIDDQKELN